MPTDPPADHPRWATHPSSTMRLDWQRFLIPQTGVLDLSDAGFLRDPPDGPLGKGPLKTLIELEALPALILLGEPGIGKSSILRVEHVRMSNLPADRQIAAVHVDLNGTSGEDGLYRRIFNCPAVEEWKAGDGHLCLSLDSLDEAMLRMETVPHVLAEGLQGLPARRLSIRVACRTAVWPAATLGRALSAMWGEAGFGVFELAPLRRRDVVAALGAHGIDPDEFIPKLFGAQAVSFAIKPLTLTMLIRLYERDGRLPDSTADLYRQGCLALCEEANDSRRETRRLGRLNGRQRLRIAGRIAAATVLGNRFAVWNGPEVEAASEDVTLQALSGASEEGDFPAFTATDDDAREALDTGLFSARGDHRIGWAHQSYCDFLAASYIIDKGVPAPTILKALTHPSGGLIPTLAVVGAWAAAMSPELRVPLIATEPWVLLRGDLSKWGSTELAALVDALLAHVEQGRFYEYFFGVSEAYERLRHPGLTAQLRAAVTDQARKPITRRVALSITEGCRLMELQPELLHAALDKGEDPMVRAGAVAALRECGDAAVPARMLSLLHGGVGHDPDTDIRGHALDLLWPGHIPSGELFPLLAPSNGQYFGSYARFLLELPSKLTVGQLRPAVDWATSYVSESNLTGEFREKTLADAIMFKAWEAFEDPYLTEPFVTHIAARLHQHGSLFRGSDASAQRSFVTRFGADASRRRRFVLLLCQRDMSRIACMPYIDAGFVRNDDFRWLLDASPAAKSPADGLSEGTLLNFISLLFKSGDDDQFEALYAACRDWPLLREHYAYVIDGVPIASEAASQGRTMQLQMQEMAERAHPPVIADIPWEIEARLADAEGGSWQAWCWLNLTLMLTPASTRMTDRTRTIASRACPDGSPPTMPRAAGS